MHIAHCLANALCKFEVAAKVLSDQVTFFHHAAKLWLSLLLFLFGKEFHHKNLVTRILCRWRALNEKFYMAFKDFPINDIASNISVIQCSRHIKKKSKFKVKWCRNQFRQKDIKQTKEDFKLNLKKKYFVWLLWFFQIACLPIVCFSSFIMKTYTQFFHLEWRSDQIYAFLYIPSWASWVC